MDLQSLREIFDIKVLQYNNPTFIELDPIQVPHRFSLKEDIEISGFLSATISWGKRTTILKYANKMIDLLGSSPYDFIVNHKEKHLKRLESFVYRTFNSDDFLFFIKALKYIYTEREGLESIFTKYQTSDSLQSAIHHLREEMLSIPHLSRTRKHISDPFQGSAAKKINLFLRWMVRKDNAGVDFGIWKYIPSSSLSCPLDLHSGKVARHYGLIQRRQNDAKALIELDSNLRLMDKDDPVRYDFALFGLGYYESIK